jgi:hypothetical protein
MSRSLCNPREWVARRNGADYSKLAVGLHTASRPQALGTDPRLGILGYGRPGPVVRLSGTCGTQGPCRLVIIPTNSVLSDSLSSRTRQAHSGLRAPREAPNCTCATGDYTTPAPLHMAEHVVYRPNLCRWHAAWTGYLLVLAVAVPCMPRPQARPSGTLLIVGNKRRCTFMSLEAVRKL